MRKRKDTLLKKFEEYKLKNAKCVNSKGGDPNPPAGFCTQFESEHVTHGDGGDGADGDWLEDGQSWNE